MAEQFDLAELERLREERDALAAQIEYICDELEDDCDVTDGPGGPRPNRAMRLRADIHRHYATHVRTYQQILAARDAAVQAEVTELKAANVKLEARVAELEAQVKACHMERDNLKGNLTDLEAYREKVRIEFANQLLDHASREGA